MNLLGRRNEMRKSKKIKIIIIDLLISRTQIRRIYDQKKTSIIILQRI